MKKIIKSENNTLKVLILEDSLTDYEFMVAQLEDAGFRLEASHAFNKTQFNEALKKNSYDIVLSDFSLPSFNAFDALEICRKLCPEVPFICVSGSIGEETAIDLLKKGAVDYVLKDRPERLPFAIKNALSEAKEKRALLKAEEQLKLLNRAIEQSPSSVIITDLKGNIEYVNPKTLHITGYTKKELIGKNPRIFKSGEKTKEEYKKLWNTILSGKEWFGEIHNKKKNGELFWESISISPILNEKQEITNFVAIKEDITERKRFEDTRKLLLEISQLTTKQISLTAFLQDVHQKLKQVIRADNFYVALYNETDNTFSFPYHVDKHDKVALNKPYDISEGYTNFVLKSNQTLMITPEHKPKVEKDRNVKGYGNEFSVWMGVPFKIKKNGKPNGVIAIQDYHNLEPYNVTDKAVMEIIAFNIGNFIERINYLEELVQAKEKSEKNEIELNVVQKITHVGSWTLNIESNEVKWTEELYKMFGFDPTLPPPPYTEHMKLFTPESWEILSTSLAKTIETGVSIELELQMVRINKNKGWMWLRGEAVFDQQNKIIGLWGAAQDITERKDIEEQLFKAKEKAEESDRLKSAFLANMSHEIRTPMNGILGFAGLLRQPELTGKQQQKYIDIIEKGGARMLDVINKIISIAKIESGIIDIQLSEMNVNNQLEFVYDSLKLEAERKNLTLSYVKALPNKEAAIKTDIEKFLSIIINLVNNAIKYTNKGNIEFGYHPKMIKGNKELEFYIKDTGIGIPKDRQNAIFERFIQADITDKMARQGVGLGLSISKAYVEMLGGKIWVESIESEGSTFFFTIPVNKDAERNTATTVLSENGATIAIPENLGLKVLIAEDDEASQILISIELEKFSKEILTATTGTEAVDMYRKNPDIDLVFMDIQMPEMNGYQATHEIRKFNKKVIIIAQTAFALTGDKEKAIEAGCNDYIAKPIHKAEFQALIHKYFDN